MVGKMIKRTYRQFNFALLLNNLKKRKKNQMKLIIQKTSFLITIFYFLIDHDFKAIYLFNLFFLIPYIMEKEFKKFESKSIKKD
jgi:predicted membrane protein